MKKFFGKLVKWVIVLMVLGGIGYWFLARFFASDEVNYVFRTVPLKIGTITVSTSATGTVEPEELVDVGSQVSGKIQEFGTDINGIEVDYGSPVREGQLLARIDPSLYEAELKQSAARVSQAEASVVSAEADLLQQKAVLKLAELNWERADNLFSSKAISKADHDAARSNYDTAAASIAVAEARIKQSTAELDSAKAQYDYAKRNLNYCDIVSPVDGIIIDRRVNIGQTVVSSMSASSLFLIAKDLKRMQIWVSVNEADIGRIKVGMPVEFTVDAFPQQQFFGEVGKIRLNASLSSNVVTYVVEVNTDNSDNKLVPYLTAKVNFIEAREHDVLLLPAAALRFIPDPAMVLPEDEAILETLGGYVLPSMRKSGVVWVEHPEIAGAVSPREVTLDLYDGVFYQVTSGLTVDDAVISGVEYGVAAGEEETTNPFLPKFPSRNRPKQQAQTRR